MLKRILNWFKKYFISHKGNEHKPHFLRWEAALAILIIVLAGELFFLLQITLIFPHYSSFFGEILNSVISFETNKARVENSVQPIKINSLLSMAAQLKANDMVQKSYFAHTSPEGKTPWYWLKEVGYEYIYAGENLAINYFESKEVVEAWMRSQTHRENILDKKFTELGIGIASGNYGGQQAIFVVQMFGKPLEKSVVSGVIASQSLPVAISSVPKKSNEKKQVLAEQNINSKEMEMTKEAEEIKEAAEIVETKETKETKEVPFYGALILVEFLTSPKTVSNFFFVTLLTIIAIALILKIGIKIKVQYPPLIVNGVLLILIIGSVILFNQYFVFYGTKLI